MKRKKLSARRSRTELLTTEFATVAPAVDAAPLASGGGGDGYEPEPYSPDADETVVCPGCSKLNSPDAQFCDQCGFQLAGADDVQTDGAPPAEDAAPVVAAMVPVADPPPAAPVGTSPTVADTSEPQNQPPPVEGGESMGPAFTIPVVIIEGQPTGDGREIAPQALTWRAPPLPLMGLATETHDADGMDLNDPAVICGRIDSLERVPGEGTTQLIVAHGFYLPNEDGMYFAELNEAMGRLGVSADVAVIATEVTVHEVDEDGWPMDTSSVLTEGRIMGATVCPYPAFEGAYIVLGDGAEMSDAQVIPQTADAPIVPDSPPAAVVAGGQLVHFFAFEECVPCAQGLEVVTAAGGPTRPPAAWFSDPGYEPGDGRMSEILDRRGDRAAGGKFACPITVTEAGQIHGHIAPWGVCHTGSAGQCILAPRSKVDYAHFKRGQHIVTAEGEKIRVGVLTADTGHAPIRGVTASQAMAHYDNTALACADVNIGEDEYGIWIAGAVRPDATDEQVRTLTASSVSGDWRALGGQLELVAALCVNQPGFPLAVVAGGQIESLVAAGAGPMHALKHPVREVGDVALRRALAPLLTSSAQQARGRVAALTASGVQSARERIAALTT